jgi:hypothetical protein
MNLTQYYYYLPVFNEKVHFRGPECHNLMFEKEINLEHGNMPCVQMNRV